MKNIHLVHKRPTYALIVLASIASSMFLIIALTGQYGFNLHPCELCVAQRVPYAIIIGIAAFSIFFNDDAKKMRRLAFLCAILFCVDGGIAMYHSGVELGIFPGPSGCTNNDKPGASIEEMRAAIMNAQLVPCDQPMAYLLGLSMASWNAIAACACGLFMFIMLKKIHRDADT